MREALVGGIRPADMQLPAGHRLKPRPLPLSTREQLCGPEAYSPVSALPTWMGTGGPGCSSELGTQAVGSENEQQRSEQEALRGREVTCVPVTSGVQPYLSSQTPKEAQHLLPPQRGSTNKAENQPVLQRSPRAAPLSGSPPGRVKAVWFHITGDPEAAGLVGSFCAAVPKGPPAAACSNT